MLMEGRFRHSQHTEKAEIGKNLSILPAHLNKNIEVLEGVTIDTLFKFKENQVKNLYCFDPQTNTFKLEHQDGDFLARATGVLNPLGVRFKVDYVDDHITEFGISYIGTIRVHHLNGIFLIKVPGELSYDPASPPGDSPWVNFYQVCKIVVVLAALVKAALFGATKKFLKRLFTVLKPIISRYYLKEELFRWIYKQVKFSCLYKKQPGAYAFYLQGIGKKYSESIQNYLANLEMLKKGDIQEMLPPPEFFKGISEEKSGDVSSKIRINETFSIKMFSSENGEEAIVPTVREITENLLKIKDKYENELDRLFLRIAELEKTKINLAPVSVEKKFSDSCPVF
jgi:hypothetical protein